MKTIIALSLLIATIASAADNPETACRAHLRNLGGAVKAYALLHDNKSPAKLSELYLEGLLDSLGDFTCPASGVSITTAGEIDAKSDYALGTGDILVREKTARHDGKALACFADGTIKPVEGGAPAAAARTTPTPTETPAERPPVATPPSGPTSVTREPGVATHTPTREEKTPPVATTAEKPGAITVQEGELSGDFSAMMGLAFAFKNDGRLVVASVQKDSMGSDMGLQAGDLVVDINEKPAPKGDGEARPVTADQLAKMVGAPADEPLQLTIRQADQSEITFSLMTGMAAMAMGGLGQSEEKADAPPAFQLVPSGTQRSVQRTAPPAPTLGPRPTGYLGARLQDNQTTGSGALVVEVARGSPAAADGGLKPGDLITAVNGEPIENSRQMAETIARFAPGTRLNLLVVRDGKNLKASVQLGARPATEH